MTGRPLQVQRLVRQHRPEQRRFIGVENIQRRKAVVNFRPFLDSHFFVSWLFVALLSPDKVFLMMT